MQLTDLFDENDGSRAVSPVIGVILMVAITVILAAVIGTFVLGLGDNVNQNASAGVTYDAGTTTVTITSLGPNTASVECGDTPSNSANTVGGTFSCAVGSNLVAVTDSGERTVIRTDIGN